MQVHRYTENLPLFKNAVVTIGTFDGVHLGHQQILFQLRQESLAINGETVIVTFHPHPRSVVSSHHSVKLINTIDERIELLAKAGVDHLVIVPFTEEFSQMSAKGYVEDFLIRRFRPHTIIIGYDHRFGHGREGDYHLLETYHEKEHFVLKEISPHIIDNNTVSATRIRKAILKGDAEDANHLLGYTFFFEGQVVDGNKLGRQLGYPTANIHVPDAEKLTPGDGIYAVEVELKDDTLKPIRWQGMMSIGVRPTIGGTNRVIEVNIFDFDKDIYGSTLRVYVSAFLRPELKFNGLEELKDQLAKDKEATISYYQSQ